MTQYQKVAGTISGNQLDYTSGKLDKSREQCLLACSGEENCEAVRYGRSTSECQMLSDVILQLSGSDANWLTYQKVKGCPEGWVAFDKSCYYFSTNFVNWNDAEDHCINLGSHLATIRSIDEHQFIVENRPFPGQYLWIGGKRSSTVAGTFVWASGEPWDFDHWAPFEPSDVREECVNIFGTYRYVDYWNDKECLLDRDPFVCERLASSHLI
ncbi:type-2 ice-structuring protein-like [Mya arenaria]|uniref:type-2 ice-structuring protein-like n=1 Tax=Mya arenaria TaxID=6604 RepID=UPI0022E6FC72|nr:type-2 ice-structuring protein-like [Mya arenaria]